MTVSYVDTVQDVSPGSAGFSLEGGKASLPILIDFDNLEDSLQDILGSCEAAGTGRLSRVTPRAHPQFTWLYADAISNIQGVSPVEQLEAENHLEASPMSVYTKYRKYICNVSFSSRPYSVLTDDSIVEGTVEWTDSDGVEQTSVYATEWLRYTEWNYEPGLELLIGTQGMLKLRGNTGVAPDGVVAPGMPSIRIPKTILRVRWHHVPYEYVYSTNSYVRSFLGRVNQTAWAGFAPGTLLYTACGITAYTPPFPKRFIDDSGFIRFSAKKLCTIEFMFEIAERSMAAGVTPTAPASVNYIQAGHNLVPWFGNRQFYYVSTTDNTADSDNTKRYPIYFSVPFELLFSDPDVSV